MTLRTLLLSSAALSALSLPAAALTAEEVWQNQTGYLTALGLVAEASPRRDGTRLVMEDFRYVASLPLGVGEITLTMPDVTLAENADGTVTITYPETFSASLQAEITAEGESIDLEMVFSLRQTGSSTTARGTPGAVTYKTSTALSDLTLDSLVVETAGDLSDDQPDLDLALSMQDIASEMTITEDDDAFLVSTLSTNGRMVFEIAVDDGMGTLSTTVGETETGSFSSSLTLPRGTVNWLDLSPALRDGLALGSTFEGAGSRQQSVTRTNGTVTEDTSQVSARDTVSSRISSAGLGIEGTSEGLAFTFTQSAEIPVPFGLPFTVTAEEASGGMVIPLLADPAPQAASFDVSLRGVSMPEDIWSLFGPRAVLPRNPATLAFGIDAQVVSRVDVPDLLAWEGVTDRIAMGESPVDLVSLNLTGLELAAIGAMITGEGAFTFDNADRTTFPGFPRPEGQASVRMTGLYGALAGLSQIGLLPTEAGIGLRGAIGMIAKATGEDELESVFVIAPDGRMTVNGLPLPRP
jgi:hypothetical protein